MTHPLYGAGLKLLRADQHLRFLQAEIRRFLDEKPYVVECNSYNEHDYEKRLPANSVKVWTETRTIFLSTLTEW
jgi:hypothetical protein